jgi:two-component system response regulator PilR (NtrC family)
MKSCLVIEDSIDTNALFCKVARRRLYLRVHGATTIEQARMMLQRKKYTVILSDLRMPHGFASDMLIEEKEAIGSTPIILISADDMETHRDRLIENGLNVVQCLTKPIETKRLMSLI